MTQRRAPRSRLNPTRPLYDLLGRMFNQRELIRFLALQDGGETLLCDLPEGLSQADFTLAAAQALERHGWIDEALFEALAEERPRRRREIAEVAALILTPPPLPPPAQCTPAPSRSPASPPSRP